MARPSKLTDEVVDKIVLAVRGGSTFKAAMYAGVGETTFHTWLSRGHEERRRLELAADELEALPQCVVLGCRRAVYELRSRFARLKPNRPRRATPTKTCAAPTS